MTEPTTRTYTINVQTHFVSATGARLGTSRGSTTVELDDDQMRHLSVSYGKGVSRHSVPFSIPRDAEDRSVVNVSFDVPIKPSERVEREIKRDAKGRITGLADLRYPVLPSS